MKSTAEIVKVSEVFAWIETERATIALKAVTREGKQVELTAEETRLLAQRLAKLADVLDSLVAQKRERADSGQ
jgi:HAMP domain-containing protein